MNTNRMIRISHTGRRLTNSRRRTGAAGSERTINHKRISAGVRTGRTTGLTLIGRMREVAGGARSLRTSPLGTGHGGSSDRRAGQAGRRARDQALRDQERAGARARGLFDARAGRRAGLRARPERLRQVDPAVGHGRPARPDRRTGAAGRRAGHPAASADRHGVPGSRTSCPGASLLKNIHLPFELKRLRPQDYRERIAHLLERVGLLGFEHKYPRELSGGMQQRASIVRSLSVDPSLLLMDEPFGALDAFTRDEMNLLLQEIWLETGKTIVFITHNIAEAVFLADRIMVMTPRPGRLANIFTIDLPRPRLAGGHGAAALLRAGRRDQGLDRPWRRPRRPRRRARLKG